ncbi:hypothetical protein, partial [Citrobacter freundii]|uniref:hypothetical protein n=1 Tax=Citrobacter freundii TaxID=546 RepID=UPI001B36BFD8
IQPMLDFRWVVKNRKIQPEAAFFPTKNQGLEWMNSNPRMQIAVFFIVIICTLIDSLPIIQHTNINVY